MTIVAAATGPYAAEAGIRSPVAGTRPAAANLEGFHAPSIDIRGVSVQFASSDGRQVTALRDVDMRVESGEFCTLIGLSGCGKSTLLNIAAGLLEPSAGTVTIGDRRVRGINPRVGYMLQRDTLLPWATAEANVRLPLDATGRRDNGQVARLMKLVGLEGFEKKYPAQLSGGMRKRVQLARLLAQEPDVFMLDEPFGALDAHTKLIMQEELLRIWEQQRRTVVFVTHDLYEAIALSDRIVMMSRRPGRVHRVFNVDIARPRDLNTVLSNSQFNHLFTEIWSELRTQANE